MQKIAAFEPPARLLMGPGPSNVAPSVLRAMSQPLVGHLDPAFIQLMEEIKGMLRSVFLTKNELTFPVSGTGSAGMEFCCVNLLEPGDEAVIGVNGVFGGRMADVAERCGARVTKVEAEWGRIIEPDQMAAALKNVRHARRRGLSRSSPSGSASCPTSNTPILTSISFSENHHNKNTHISLPQLARASQGP